MRIDFYATEAAGANAAAYLLCRVVEKGYRQGRRFLINAADPQQARLLDDLLWTFRQGSFVPHAPTRDKQTPRPPILIGIDEAPEAEGDVLVNLALEVPSFWDRFQRIVEVVDGNEPGRRQARRRFRWYKEHGCEMQYHKMNN